MVRLREFHRTKLSYPTGRSKDGQAVTVGSSSMNGGYLHTCPSQIHTYIKDDDMFHRVVSISVVWFGEGRYGICGL